MTDCAVQCPRCRSSIDLVMMTLTTPWGTNQSRWFCCCCEKSVGDLFDSGPVLDAEPDLELQSASGNPMGINLYIRSQEGHP